MSQLEERPESRSWILWVVVWIACAALALTVFGCKAVHDDGTPTTFGKMLGVSDAAAVIAKQSPRGIAGEIALGINLLLNSLAAGAGFKLGQKRERKARERALT